MSDSEKMDKVGVPVTQDDEFLVLVDWRVREGTCWRSGHAVGNGVGHTKFETLRKRRVEPTVALI